MRCLCYSCEFGEKQKLLSIAMARQVAVFIGSKDDTVDCIVASAYENAVVSEAVARYEIPKRLYDGDDLWVEQYDRCHAVGCYQKFTHQWSIQNRGRCLWSGRKLVCTNQNEIKPQFAPLTIDIPETKPQEFIKITTGADSRGIETLITACGKCRILTEIIAFQTADSYSTLLLVLHSKLKVRRKTSG